MQEKIPIRRLEVAISSKDPNSDDEVVELDHLPTPPPQNDLVVVEANEPQETDDPQQPNKQETKTQIINLDRPENQVEEGNYAKCGDY